MHHPPFPCRGPTKTVHLANCANCLVHAYRARRAPPPPAATGTTLHSALGCGVPQEYVSFGRMDVYRIKAYKVLILVRGAGLRHGRRGICFHSCATLSAKLGPSSPVLAQRSLAPFLTPSCPPSLLPLAPTGRGVHDQCRVLDGAGARGGGSKRYGYVLCAAVRAFHTWLTTERNAGISPLLAAAGRGANHSPHPLRPPAPAGSTASRGAAADL